MIVEVNDAGEILIRAELVQAAPRTRLKADREGDSVVLKQLAERPIAKGRSILDALPVLEGRITDPSMTFGRDDIYDSDGR